MLERGGSQHFNSPVVGQHVRQVQTQLGVAVEGGGSAGLRYTADLDAAAILFRVNSNGTGANDDVARLVGLSGYRNGQQDGGEERCEAEAGCKSGHVQSPNVLDSCYSTACPGSDY